MEQSTNPAFADSLVNRVPPQKVKAKLDLHNLTVEQFKAIAERGM